MAAFVCRDRIAGGLGPPPTLQDMQAFNLGHQLTDLSYTVSLRKTSE